MEKNGDAVEIQTPDAATPATEPETATPATEPETEKPESQAEAEAKTNELEIESEITVYDEELKPEETEPKTTIENPVTDDKDHSRSANGNGTSFNSSYSRDIENLVSEVQGLHDLDEEVWSLRKYHYSPKGTTCRGAYNSERSMIRIKGAVEAPLERVLSYILEPPYGYRKDTQSSYRVIEKIGSGAVLIYKEKPEQTECCFRIAPRDGVYLAILRMLTSETAIFAMKTVEHSSYPPNEDGYRMSVPLIGFYLKQEGDLTTIEYYFAETDLGGKLGKSGPGKSIAGNVKYMVRLSQTIPKVKDGVPPYKQLI